MKKGHCFLESHVIRYSTMSKHDSNGAWPPDAPDEQELADAKAIFFDAISDELGTLLTTEKERGFLEELTVDHVVMQVIDQFILTSLKHPFFMLNVAIGHKRKYEGIGESRHTREFQYHPDHALRLLCGIAKKARKAIAVMLVREQWDLLLESRRHNLGLSQDAAPEEIIDEVTERHRKRLKRLYKMVLSGVPPPKEEKEEDD